MADVLVAAGITLNLAPVVDLAVNPTNPIIAAVDRSYGADPDVVISQAAAFIEGHHAAGVACTLKHFPGHGSSPATRISAWSTSPTPGRRSSWSPSPRWSSEGWLSAVLTAHVFNANLDP